MQPKMMFALTPALSLRRGRSFRMSLKDSGGDSFQRGQMVLPLLRERAGVRASLYSH